MADEATTSATDGGPRGPIGLLYLVLGLAGLAGTAYRLWVATTQPGVVHSVVLTAALLLGGVLFSVLGMSALRPRPERPAGSRVDHRHAVTLFIATVIVLAGVGGLLEALVPDGYGLYGNYRAGAVAQARAQEPRHLGEAACLDCHEQEAALHDKDAHTHVPCESCHGPGIHHAKFHHARAEGDETPVPDTAKMEIREGRDWCLRCHSVDAARPGGFPQIDWETHMELTGLADKELPCKTCHSPHEPLYMDRDIREARLHPTIHQCRDCHGPDVKTDDPVPDGHPAIFQCAYCHEDVAAKPAKYPEMPHQNIACTTCHPFFQDSIFAGRIIRDTDPRFCLLCHKKAKFRHEDWEAPQIKWPRHRDRMKDDDDDERQLCNECHQWALHWPEGYYDPVEEPEPAGDEAAPAPAGAADEATDEAAEPPAEDAEGEEGSP